MTKITEQRLSSLAAAHRMLMEHDRVLEQPYTLEEVSQLAAELKAARKAMRSLVDGEDSNDHVLALARAALEGVRA